MKLIHVETLEEVAMDRPTFTWCMATHRGLDQYELQCLQKAAEKHRHRKLSQNKPTGPNDIQILLSEHRSHQSPESIKVRLEGSHHR